MARRHGEQAVTRWLLLAGGVAGPFFVVVAVAQMLVRDGFDVWRHPVSLLANGDGGWIQVSNFIITGLLMLTFAVGVRRHLASGIGSLWSPILFAVCGVGLIIGGLFPADPALGFPGGAPAGIPESMSAAGVIHAVAPPLAFTALVVALVITARRLWRDGHGALAIVTGIGAGATFLLSLPVWPTIASIFAAIIVGFGIVTILSYLMMHTAQPASVPQPLRSRERTT